MKKFLEVLVIVVVVLGISLGFLAVNPQWGISQKILPLFTANTPAGVETGTTQTTGIDLTNCISYFDGCNNCSVQSGQVAACTKMYCETPSAPKCLEYARTGSESTGNVIQTSTIETKGNEKIIINSNYSKDTKNVYLDGYVVVGLDVRTVQEVSNWYIKDSKHVYRGPKQIPGADPDSFGVFDADGVFTKDKNHVYDGRDILEGADPETFRSFNWFSNNTIFKARDKNYVYDSDGKVIPGIDGGSFEMIASEGLFRAKDKNHVYNGFPLNGIIEGADPATIIPLNNDYAKDKYTVFYYPSAGIFMKIEGADPETFEVVKGNKNYNAQDKNRKYYNGTPVD